MPPNENYPEPTLTFEDHDLPDIPGTLADITPEPPAKQAKSFAIQYEQRVLTDPTPFLPEHDSPTYRFTEQVLKDLTLCFVKDHTIKFACLKAGITETEYQTVTQNNPKIAEFFSSLREIPQAIAQEGIIDDIKVDKQSRQWYAETRMSSKYSKKQQVEHTVNMSSLLDQMEQTDKPTQLSVVDEQ